jgi:hypothetical protein
MAPLSEVDTGSREENAQNIDTGTPAQRFRLQANSNDEC